MKESIDLCGKCYVPSIFNCTEFPPHLPEWKDWLNRSADTIKVIEFAFIVIVLKGRGGALLHCTSAIGYSTVMEKPHSCSCLS